MSPTGIRILVISYGTILATGVFAFAAFFSSEYRRRGGDRTRAAIGAMALIAGLLPLPLASIISVSSPALVSPWMWRAYLLAIILLLGRILIARKYQLARKNFVARVLQWPFVAIILLLGLTALVIPSAILVIRLAF